MTDATAKRYTIREFVRWSDVDKAGIIFYGAYVRFFEIAETELFRSMGLPYSQMFEKLNIWLPRKQLQFEFHSPALLDDLLEIEVWVGHIGRTSFRLDFEAFKPTGAGERRMTANGHVVMVATDREMLRPVPVPEALVELLRPYAT
ncbi:MAG TPA: thioesterase family protein [Blastocatellia bacterium]|nr:thioesterase family protein [Blastocatellia bacterium]